MERMRSAFLRATCSETQAVDQYNKALWNVRMQETVCFCRRPQHRKEDRIQQTLRLDRKPFHAKLTMKLIVLLQ